MTNNTEFKPTDKPRDWIEATIRRQRALQGTTKRRRDGTAKQEARRRPIKPGEKATSNPEDDATPLCTEWMDVAVSEVWTRLGTLPAGLRLYGGAAFALYLEHRTPGGLDWATPEAPVTTDAIGALMADRGLECEVRSETGRVECTTTGKHVVNMNFAECGASVPAPAEPARPGPLGTPVAAPLDLVASKLRCIERRSEARDYIDLAEAERRWPGIIRRAEERLHADVPAREGALQRAEPPEHIAAELSGEQLKALQRAGGSRKARSDRGNRRDPA